MLSGKTVLVSRAFFGFLLVDHALHTLLMKEMFGISLSRTHDSFWYAGNKFQRIRWICCKSMRVVRPINCKRRNCWISRI